MFFHFFLFSLSFLFYLMYFNFYLPTTEYYIIKIPFFPMELWLASSLGKGEINNLETVVGK